MNITLSAESQRLIEERVRSGQYQSAEQVIEEALHALAWRDREVEETPEETARLRALVKVGLDQLDRGQCKPIDFDELEARLLREHVERTAKRGRGNAAG